MAQVCQIIALCGEVHCHAVVPGAFLLQFNLALPQLGKLAQGGVEGGLAAAALENFIGLLVQQLERLAGRTQPRPEACAVQGVAYAFVSEAVEVFKLSEAEAEHVAVHIAAHAGEHLAQHVRFQRFALRVGEGEHAAVAAGPPGKAQNAAVVRAQFHAAAGLPAAQGAGNTLVFLVARVGIADEHGTQKFQAGGFARFVFTQKNGKPRREIFNAHIRKNTEAVHVEGLDIHQRASRRSVHRRSASSRRARIRASSGWVRIWRSCPWS